MARRGRTFSVEVQPASPQDANEYELKTPFHRDLRNGRVSAAGNWVRRFAYETVTHDLGASQRVIRLYSADALYAHTADGHIHWCGPNGATRDLGYIGTKRGNVVRFLDWWYIAAGNGVYTLHPRGVTRQSGSPDKADSVAVAGSRLIASDGSRYFYASDQGAPGSWSANSVWSIEPRGEGIQAIRSLRGRLLVFGDSHAEVWDQTAAVESGVPIVFARASYIETGLLSRDTLVYIPERSLFMFGHTDGGFHVLSGADSEPLEIPQRVLWDQITDRKSLYAVVTRADHTIRIFDDDSGACFAFDYLRNNWSRDNGWANAGWSRLGISSAVNHEGIDYVGSYEPVGKVYRWAQDAKTDDGAPVRLYRRLATSLSGVGETVRCSAMRLSARRDEGSVERNEAFGLVRWRLDQGEWAEEHLSLGLAGERTPIQEIGELGVGTELELELIQSEEADLLLDQVYLNLARLGR